MQNFIFCAVTFHKEKVQKLVNLWYSTKERRLKQDKHKASK